MRCCVISVSDRKYSLISGIDPSFAIIPKDAPADTRPVLLTPAKDADFRVAANGTALRCGTEPLLLSLALSFFFHSVRGLPFGSVTVEQTECEGSRILQIFDTGVNKQGVVLPKCKELSTSTYTLEDGVGLAVYEMLVNEWRRGIFAELPNRLDTGVLRRVLAPRGKSAILRSLAVGLREPYELVLPEGAPLDLEALSCAVCMLERRLSLGDTVTLLFGDARFTLNRANGEYLIPMSAEIIC